MASASRLNSEQERKAIPTTQKDIARHLGLSRSTVVQALNNIGQLAPETRERVLQAARELGYQPNSLARALVTGKTHTLGFWYSPALTTPSVRLINGLEKEVFPYKLLLNNVWSRDKELASPDLFPAADWPVDGIIALSIKDIPGWLLQEGKLTKPFVSIFYDAFPYRPTAQMDAIMIKLSPGCEAAVQHLVQTRQRVAMLCVPMMSLYGDVRVKAYEAALRAAGRQPEYIMPTQGMAVRPAARQGVLDYVRAHGCPDAIYCGNDEQAISAHGALHELGYRVPQDVALIGNDGFEEAEYHVPPLSTVSHPFDAMIHHAWEFLQNRMTHPNAPRQYIELEAPLLLRASSEN